MYLYSMCVNVFVLCFYVFMLVIVLFHFGKDVLFVLYNCVESLCVNISLGLADL